MKTSKLLKKIKTKKSYFMWLITGFLIAVLTLKLIPLFILKAQTVSYSFPFVKKNLPTPTPDTAIKQEEITKMVLPDKLDLGITLGDTIVQLVKFGAIDKDKFAKIYEGRGGLKPSEQKLLDEVSNEKLVVTQENSGLILNLLWPLGIANKTNVLSSGPMGTEYKKDVGNFASTGGWTLGREAGGNLFNRFDIIPLTSEQETEVTEIANNIYRPCCGNSTYFPDCNHGAAMLGFIELAVSQGIPKDEIYKKALVLNSYWFPQTYMELATYFKIKKGIPWNQVDPKEILGNNYSSGQGSRVVNKELQDANLIPQVQGGGGCGV